jgi:hypothetical protein
MQLTGCVLLVHPAHHLPSHPFLLGQQPLENLLLKSRALWFDMTILTTVITSHDGPVVAVNNHRDQQACIHLPSPSPGQGNQMLFD